MDDVNMQIHKCEDLSIKLFNTMISVLHIYVSAV